MFLKEFCRDSRGICKGARLESVYTVKGIVGSNPTLSAILINFIDFNIKDSYIYTLREVFFYKFKKG